MMDIWVAYFMHICILTADYTVKRVLSGHSKKKTNYRLMQVKSIVECSKGSILQSFQPSLRYHLLLRSMFWPFWSGCLRQVLLYWQPTCTLCLEEFVLTVRWILKFLLKRDYFTTKKEWSIGPTALESDGPYFEIMRQWPGSTINLKACSSCSSTCILLFH